MAMFATLAAVALSTMAFSSANFQGSQPTARVEAPDFGKADSKTSRLPMTSRPASACNGVAWGVETPECLRQIALESGRDTPRAIRIIMSAEIDHQRPNIF